jgi:hypothetical protein
VPDHEFLFALELSDEAHFETMVVELAGAVLAHVGYQSVAIDELRTGLRDALASCATRGDRRCDVQFRAHAGGLDLVVTGASGAEWRTTRALP